MIKIEKNIPLAAVRSSQKKFPFQEMEVGDSFFIPSAGKLHSTRVSILAASKRYGVKCVTRSVEEDGEKGIRAWRIE